MEKLRILKNEAEKRAWLVAHGDDGRLEERLRLCIDAWKHKKENGLGGWEVHVLAVVPCQDDGETQNTVYRVVRETHMSRQAVFFIHSDTVHAVSIADEDRFEVI